MLIKNLYFLFFALNILVHTNLFVMKRVADVQVEFFYQKSIKFFLDIPDQDKHNPEAIFYKITAFDLPKINWDSIAWCLRQSWRINKNIYALVNGAGQNIMHLAFTANNIAVAYIIMQAFDEIPAGHFFAITDGEGNTPLHCAAKYGSLEIAHWFLLNANNLNSSSSFKFRNSQGQTPMDLANISGNIEIFFLLDEAENKISEFKTRRL